MRKPQLRRWRRPCGNTTTSAIRSRKPGSLPIRPPCPTRASPRGAMAWNRRRTASTASSRRLGTTAKGLPMAKRRRRWFPPSRPRWKAKPSSSVPEEIYPHSGANTEQAPCGRKKAASPLPMSRPPRRSSTTLLPRRRTTRALLPRRPEPMRKPASSTLTRTDGATPLRHVPTSPGALFPLQHGSYRLRSLV